MHIKMRGLPFVLCTLVASLVSASKSSAGHSSLAIFATIDSTSGVLINRSFTNHGIKEVMEVARTGAIRYPGAPAVSYGFDPVQVRDLEI